MSVLERRLRFAIAIVDFFDSYGDTSNAMVAALLCKRMERRNLFVWAQVSMAERKISCPSSANSFSAALLFLCGKFVILPAMLSSNEVAAASLCSRATLESF